MVPTVKTTQEAIAFQNQRAVPVAIREQLFGKFVTFSKQGGTGFRAISAKMLTQAKNGAISLDVPDNENQTRITVSLPRHTLCAQAHGEWEIWQL